MAFYFLDPPFFGHGLFGERRVIFKITLWQDHFLGNAPSKLHKIAWRVILLITLFGARNVPGNAGLMISLAPLCLIGFGPGFHSGL